MSLPKGVLLDSARKAEKRGSLLEAVAFLESACEQDQYDSMTWTWLGNLKTELEQYWEAEDCYAHALEIESDSCGAMLGLASVYRELGQLEDAEHLLKKILAIRQSSSVYVLLGDLQVSNGAFSEAERSFRKALELDTRSEEAMYNLAVHLRMETGSANPEIEQLLRQAIEIDPEYFEAYRELGFVLGRTDREVEAERNFRQAIVLDPGDAWSHIYLAALLADSGRAAEAESALMDACRSDPLWSYPQSRLARFYEKLDRQTEAAKTYRSAVRINPADAEANYELGQYLIRRGNVARGSAWLKRALTLEPGHEEAAKALRECT